MQKWKILLADDDPEDRAIIKDAMEQIEAGDLIQFAENGEQALQILHQQFEQGIYPCLVVLDLNMPKINGTETLYRLKSDPRFRNVPVIIFSTSINSIEKEKCMRLGAHSYITKPVSLHECIETAQTFYRFCQTSVV